jgi:hypothetical protein
MHGPVHIVLAEHTRHGCRVCSVKSSVNAFAMNAIHAINAMPLLVRWPMRAHARPMRRAADAGPPPINGRCLPSRPDASHGARIPLHGEHMPATLSCQCSVRLLGAHPVSCPAAVRASPGLSCRPPPGRAARGAPQRRRAQRRRVRQWRSSRSTDASSCCRRSAGATFAAQRSSVRCRLVSLMATDCC